MRLYFSVRHQTDWSQFQNWTVLTNQLQYFNWLLILPNPEQFIVFWKLPKYWQELKLFTNIWFFPKKICNWVARHNGSYNEGWGGHIYLLLWPAPALPSEPSPISLRTCAGMLDLSTKTVITSSNFFILFSTSFSFSSYFLFSAFFFSILLFLFLF